MDTVSQSPAQTLEGSPSSIALNAVAKPLYVTLFFAVVYLLTPTADYFWDGITFALQVEKVAEGERGAALLFHQSHLLYNVFGYLLYQSAHTLGWNVRALDLLQLANSIIGAVGVGLFFTITRRLTRDVYASLISALFLGVSVTWWKLATDCDAYTLSTTLLLGCLLNLTDERPRWYIAGISLALAMLMHELASVFTFAALAAVWMNEAVRQKKRFALLMTTLAWGVAVGTYYVVAYTLMGLSKPLDVVRWATTNPSLVEPERNPLPGLLKTPRTNLDLLFGHSFTLFRQTDDWLAWGFAIAAAIFLALFIITAAQKNRLPQFFKTLRPAVIKSDKSFRRHLFFLLVWVVPYNLFLLFFEPQDPYLRLFYAPAIALALGTVLSRFHANTGQSNSATSDSINSPPANPYEVEATRPSGAAAFAVAAFACFNLAFFIVLFMRAASNPLIVEARRTKNVWTEKTVIFFVKRNEADTTFEYFNKQAKWRRLQPELLPRLAYEINELHRQGGDVWLKKGAQDAIGEGLFTKFERGKEIVVSRDFSPAHYVQVLPGEP